MCQIVGIPSHSRVELQLILQDTKNYLYHKTTARNTHAMKKYCSCALTKIFALFKYCHLKDEQGNEHLWTHVEFLRHLTLICTVILLQKWLSNVLKMNWLLKIELYKELLSSYDIYGNCRLHVSIISSYEALLLLSKITTFEN